MDGSSPKDFPANVDRDSIVENLMPPGILAKYVSLIPTTSHNRMAVRFEVKGCNG